MRGIVGVDTSKIKALTRSYMHLVKELCTLTSNILCVTFANKAAKKGKLSKQKVK